MNIISYLIVISLVFFTILHFLPLVQSKREILVSSMGEKRYYLIFSLLAGLSFFLAFYLMRVNAGIESGEINVFLFQKAHSYLPLVSILILSGYLPLGFIRTTLKHPMLIGMLIWSSSHFFINDNLNHRLFFMGLFLFSITMFLGLLLRGNRNSVKSASLKFDILAIVLGLGLHAVLVLLHGYIAGVAL